MERKDEKKSDRRLETIKERGEVAIQIRSKPNRAYIGRKREKKKSTRKK